MAVFRLGEFGHARAERARFPGTGSGRRTSSMSHSAPSAAAPRRRSASEAKIVKTRLSERADNYRLLGERTTQIALRPAIVFSMQFSGSIRPICCARMSPSSTLARCSTSSPSVRRKRATPPLATSLPMSSKPSVSRSERDGRENQFLPVDPVRCGLPGIRNCQSPWATRSRWGFAVVAMGDTSLRRELRNERAAPLIVRARCRGSRVSFDRGNSICGPSGARPRSLAAIRLGPSSAENSSKRLRWREWIEKRTASGFSNSTCMPRVWEENQ